MSIRGWVYVLTNKSMPGLVKVGHSTKDPHLRARELDGTGLPHPFSVAFDVLVLNPRDVEFGVHRALNSFHERKEFFRVTVGGAIAAIHNEILRQGKQALCSQSATSEKSEAVAVAEPTYLTDPIAHWAPQVPAHFLLKNGYKCLKDLACLDLNGDLTTLIPGLPPSFHVSVRALACKAKREISELK